MQEQNFRPLDLRKHRFDISEHDFDGCLKLPCGRGGRRDLPGRAVSYACLCEKNPVAAVSPGGIAKLVWLVMLKASSLN